MKNIAIITTAFGNGLPDREKKYAPLAKELGLNIRYCTKEQLLSHPEGIEGVIVGVEKADKQLFTCPDLRVAMKFGVGLDNFDLDSAKAANIQIVNMPGINSEAVAEMALALMLCVTRMIVPMANHLSDGEFIQYCSHSVKGKTIGIIGMGTIGQKVALKAQAFGMECIGYDVRPFQVEGVSSVDLPYLFSHADVISAHLPLLPSTFHIIGKEAFAQMKEGVIILNTSRGGIVDDKELYAQVKKGKVYGAGLDVFESEETMKELANLPNVICTPHVSAYTHETLRLMEETALRKITTCLAGAK